MLKKRIRQFGYLMLLVALFFGVQDIVAPKGLGSMAAATEFSVAITQDLNRPSLDKSKVAYLTFDDGPDIKKTRCVNTRSPCRQYNALRIVQYKAYCN